MPRHLHEVRVIAARNGSSIYLLCLCGWKGEMLQRPTVSRLAELAHDHRLEAQQ